MMEFDWKNILGSRSSDQILCLWGKAFWTKDQSKMLQRSIENSVDTTYRTSKVSIVQSRDEYIQRHSYEGLFFQQRFQSVYADQGETVESMIRSQAEKFRVKDWREHTDLFELENIWTKPLIQLSSGEWQRFSLCFSLFQNPDILIAIHGLDGLDIDWKRKIPQILAEHYSHIKKIIFTSDQPLLHPIVKNIGLNQSDSSHISSSKKIPSRSLIRGFQNYHNSLRKADNEAPVIEMKNVSIRYGENQILDQVNWTVLPGEKWNIRGPNGAGKSTLISLINSDNPQGYSQSISVFGSPFGQKSIWERKARIAYFSSDYFQYFRSHRTVESVIRDQLKTPYLKTPQPPEDLLREMIDYFDLSDHLHLPYSGMDRSIRRQVLLLATYLKSSELLILDEPYHDFDHAQISANNLFLESTQHKILQTVIFVTHRSDHMPSFLDRGLEMDQGRAQEISL